ncbi:DUF397 domain-containing protein [Streptomyces sp. NPDC020490]|uniref:DUF397 domain-containing protein n=1 Tax=Streptomyces sp. NPDC020490 TaxID=3365078 RepID=UPI003798DA0D
MPVEERGELRVLAAKHGSIRGQALNPRESLRLIEKWDSKERGGLQLAFPRSAWSGFVPGLERGRI